MYGNVLAAKYPVTMYSSGQVINARACRGDLHLHTHTRIHQSNRVSVVRKRVMLTETRDDNAHIDYDNVVDNSTRCDRNYEATFVQGYTVTG